MIDEVLACQGCGVGCGCGRFGALQAVLVLVFILPPASRPNPARNCLQHSTSRILPNYKFELRAGCICWVLPCQFSAAIGPADLRAAKRCCMCTFCRYVHTCSSTRWRPRRNEHLMGRRLCCLGRTPRWVWCINVKWQAHTSTANTTSLPPTGLAQA